MSAATHTDLDLFLRIISWMVELGRNNSSSLSLVVVELATSPLSWRFTLRNLLFSAELIEDDEAEAVVGCVDDAVDEAVPEETPRSRETSLISKHSIFVDFFFFLNCLAMSLRIIYNLTV